MSNPSQPELHSGSTPKETWYRSILHAVPDAVVTMDVCGRVVDWSPQAEVLFGWSRSETLGRTLGDLIVPPRHREAHRKGLQKYRETGEGPILNQRLEMTALKRDGTPFPVELSITTTRLAEQVLFTGFLRDITQRKQAEYRTTRRRLETHLVHQAASLSSDAQSLEGALQNCIEVMCSITGWPAGHALLVDVSKNVLSSTDIWHLADEETYRGLRDASRTKSFRPGEGLPGRIWRQGEAVWTTDLADDDRLTANHAAIHGAFGFPVMVDAETVAVLEFFSPQEVAPDPNLLMLVGSVGTQLGRMIEHRHWEQARARLAAIVDSSYDAIISKDADGRILSWNTGAQYVYGFSPEEAIGQRINIILPQGLDHEEPEIRHALQSGQQLSQFETMRVRKDGTEIAVAVTVSPIRDSGGRVVGSSTIERDISLRKRREHELQVAMERAEEANRAKSEFLANISHELRTPMNAIIGMLELALGEELSAAIRDYLDTACDSAHTLLHLLDDLLDYSRMEAGRFELDDEPFNLRETLDATMKTLSLRAHEKGLELLYKIDNDVPLQLDGDGKRLRQVITNLAGNAVKFTEQGEVVVSVAIQSRSEDAVELLLKVHDTGEGIARADQHRIFAPFTQADASTTRRQPGAGLGLAICSELIEQMGGRIWLESEPGSGTSFYCTARFRVVPGADQEAAVVPKLRNVPVLVVDDNETNRTIVEETLNNWSMRPKVVADGQTALEVFREAQAAGHAFPLVVVDALMPGMDGFTLIKLLQDVGLDDSAAVLMLSSSDRQLFLDRCEGLEIGAYLEKPVSQSNMLDAVVTALEGTQPSHAGNQVRRRAGQPLDVLLVEDTPANQKIVKAILEKRGHEVTIAGNGRKALELHNQQAFDVILMDVQMPTMDGLQATEAIRELPDRRKSRIPIIAMTAHARREDRLSCVKAGMDAYIAKPIDASKLMLLVETTQHEADGSSRAIVPQKTAPQTSIRGTSPMFIDRSVALARLGGNENLFADLARYFLEDVPDLLKDLATALAAGNTDDVVRAAHSIKGMAANFEAPLVVEAAQEIEDAGRAGDLVAAGDTLPKLEGLVERLAEELQTYV